MIAKESEDRTSSRELLDRFNHPYGIGGWLLIPLYLLVLQAYTRCHLFAMEYVPSIFSLDFCYYFNSEYNVYNPELGILILFEATMNLLLCVWSILCIYLILRKSIAVRIWCSGFFIASAVFFLIDNILRVICIPNFQMFNDASSMITFLMGTLWPVIWGVYFLKSKRVSRTFGHSEEFIVASEASKSEEQMTVLLFKRCAARILDIMVVLSLGLLIGKATFQSQSSVGFECTALMHIRWLIIYDLIIFALFKQTIGKKLFGLRVIRFDGEPLSRKQYLYRSGNALFFLCWPLWVLFSIATMRYFWKLAILSLICSFVFQYCKVLKTGRTSYDAVYNTQVVDTPLTLKQKILAIGGLMGGLLLLVAVTHA